MAFTDVDFFENALGFSATDSLELAKFTKLACLAMGGAMGTGLALSTMSNPGGAQAPANIKFAAALAGLFVGASIGTSSCMSIRSKIVDFIDSVRHLSLPSAISQMTPKQREELRAEGRRLLSLRDKILNLEREHLKSPGIRGDQMA